MRAAEAATPVADGELDALFAPVAGASTIALAVSGGADSLALLDCVDRWRRRRGRPEAIVLTVDHRLRPGSDREAAEVVAVAQSRGLRGRVLVREGPPPAGDVEAAARAARYRLLIRAAGAEGASHLLTAHHRDDHAETFLMRLARGSAVFGLAAMRPTVRAGVVAIVRPFLELAQSRLAATAAAAGLAPVVDPMNADPRYLRARIRLLLPALAAEGLDGEALAATARRLAGAADALDQWTSRVIAGTVTVDAFAIAWLDRAGFLAEPEEIRLRLLARLLIAVGGEPYPPRFERLSALQAGMTGDGRLKRTLAGAVIDARGKRFAIYREVGREGLPEIAVAPGFTGIFDHRFSVEIGPGAPDGLTLSGLGEEGRRETGARPDVPPGALTALPAIRRHGTLIAVPSLGWQKEGWAFAAAARPIVAERLAEPPRFPEVALD